ncbi:uncharacterized protein LOC143842760 [Paroedura picta]|uniref:uncharacterized protein LOC143842760 n=1 Tax=Paroedura picta TaxID=143630 RepID=UPI0040574EDF
MLGIQAILITLLVCLLILYLLKQLWLTRSYPPGPLRLPFIGSIWKLGFTSSKDIFIQLAKQYGNIYMLWMGPIKVVVLSGYEAVTEGLVNHSEDFVDRPVTPFLKAVANERGIIFSNGHNWKQQRKFGLVTMRKLGLGKKGMQQQIEEEALQLAEIFAHAKGQPFDPAMPITISVSNVICATAFGHRFSVDDKEFLKLVEAVDNILKFSATFIHTLFEIFPWLMKHLPGPQQKALASSDFIHAFARNEFKKHKEHQAFHEPQDFMDFYLSQMRQSKKDPKSTYNEENLIQCIFDLFGAGTETTTLTLRWALLLMANHPDIQGKVHKEIEDVLGSSRSFSYQDLKKLPYTNAVIHEIMRSQYILYFSIPRQCTNDVNILGYLIPKDTIVITDLRSVLLDPKQWENPQEFNPSRFLNKDGSFMEREAFLPFGAGARVCLGEQLARIEIFIFFTTLLQAFTFQLPEGVKKLSTEPVVGLSLVPQPYKLCAVPRFSEWKEKPQEEQHSAHPGERYKSKEVRAMLGTQAILIALLVGLLILNHLKQLWSHKSSPPGSCSLPFCGSLWKIGFVLSEDTFIKLAKEYGNIYTFWFGNIRVIVLSGYEAVIEALANHEEDFIDRPETPYLKAMANEQGIILSNGHTWKQQRKFGVATMRKLGLGKKGMEHQVEEEAHQLVEAFTLAKGQPFDPAMPITLSVSNVICALAFGQRFSTEDKEFLKLTEAIEYILKYTTTIINFFYSRFPWLMKHLPGPHQKAFAYRDFIHAFARKEIEKHKENQAVHEPQDFIDFYLCQMNKSKNDPNSTYNEENLTQCIFDLFSAGTETTSVTLQWALLLMANHPNIQEKVHKEIEDVLGSSRSFSYQDWKKLPYTNAVIHEIMRFKYILISTIPRKCVKDVNIFGYLIPKDTLIILDFRSVLLDPKQWEKPLEFNPNHFLDKDGGFVKREAFLPFGQGARNCLGEQLARIEIFIFFTTLLRMFTFQLPEGVKQLSIEPVLGLTLVPRPYKLCAVRRHSAS